VDCLQISALPVALAGSVGSRSVRLPNAVPIVVINLAASRAAGPASVAGPELRTSAARLPASVELLEHPELGTEAIHGIVVVDFPAFIPSTTRATTSSGSCRW
jgi:hypothetical protein